MAFEAGQVKKGGRAKGVGNKFTPEVKAMLQSICADYILGEGGKSLTADLAVLRPVDRVTAVEKLLKYVLPTLGSLKVEGNPDGEPIKIIVEYVDKPVKTQEEEDAESEGMDYSIEL